MKRIGFLCLLCVLLTEATEAQQIILVQEASRISFQIKSWGFRVDGKFAGLKAEGRWDENNLPGSWFKASVQSETVDANIDARNKSLRGEDYFYVEKFPLISIHSTSIQKTAAGYLMKAVLKMRDVEKAVSIPFTALQQGEQVVLDGRFRVARLEYGVGPSIFSLGDEADVRIHCVIKIKE